MYVLFGSSASISDSFVDLAAPELVKFGIESKFSSYLTSTAQFKDAIREAMLDMKSLCPVDVRDVLISSSL